MLETSRTKRCSSDVKSSTFPSAIPVSYGGGGYYGIGTSMKIKILNIRIGVIIDKGGETIIYL
ncbi:hypothetical protein Ddye_000489 [Dipteronia dyeriana]|uniref:Uncharacterized protein n=1 Tax=Dipteronia dyeriana TaxID=168575 RepID=A0AAE0CSE9_9ROSI|nr:hypothetical protein Ddye_000489 [Dipteronia dyeriana]